MGPFALDEELWRLQAAAAFAMSLLAEAMVIVIVVFVVVWGLWLFVLCVEAVATTHHFIDYCPRAFTVCPHIDFWLM